eukprot:196428-Karenia_brevis.AAC.1
MKGHCPELTRGVSEYPHIFSDSIRYHRRDDDTVQPITGLLPCYIPPWAAYCGCHNPCSSCLHDHAHPAHRTSIAI